ncbi:MAG: VOC family protein [Acidimicrobiales bacterium]
MRSRFHLAIPVDNLEAARDFYGGIIGCSEGRSSDAWVDFDFYDHQLVVHQVAGGDPDAGSNAVDGKRVPVPHFGLVLSVEEWNSLAERLREANTHFVIEPYTRFEGEVSEQSTMFLRDPAGNALEFKAFADEAQIFAS